MKRALLILLMAAAAVVAWIWFANLRGEERIDDAPPAPVAADNAARGAYLARAGNCMACHTERGGAPFAGGRAIDTPFGTVFTSNLTPDQRTGIGAWSASHFWRAMHNGRSRDGRLLYPAFPYPHYTRITRADSDALFDHLRSQPAVERENLQHRLRWPYSTQAALAVWRALYFKPGAHENQPSRSAQWNRGAYLVTGLGHCSACHSTRNALGASDISDLSGGMVPMQNWYAPSLASPAEAGVAAWPLDDIARLLLTGTAPNATVMGPMAEVVLHSTQYLAPTDLQAMAVFLKDLPQVAPASLSPPAPANADRVRRGAGLYENHCAQCHGAQGQGVPGAYPALKNNRAVLLPVTANLVQVVLNGGFAPATTGHPRPFGMPPFATVLSDADVATVLTYVRTAWGNTAPPVSELDVARQRGSTPN
jgi:mono/diheme cytochrome c family protein